MQKHYIITRAHLSLLAANLIYGINFSIAKDIMPVSIKPFALVTLRTVVTAILFWIISLFLPKDKVTGKDIFFMFACSFIGVVINQSLFLAGLNLTTPINSSLIQTMNPIAAFIFAAAILKEDISFIKMTGLTIGLSGVVLLILQGGQPQFGSATFTGNLYILLSTISWALYTVVIKRMLEKYHPVTVMKWTYLFGLLTTIPLGYSEFRATNWSGLTMNEWFSIGFVVVAATFLGNLLISSGLKNVSPTVVSSYAYLQPLIAAFIASLIGQDRPDAVKIVSAILIFTGVYLVSKPQPFKFSYIRKTSHNPPPERGRLS